MTKKLLYLTVNTKRAPWYVSGCGAVTPVLWGTLGSKRLSYALFQSRSCVHAKVIAWNYNNERKRTGNASHWKCSVTVNCDSCLLSLYVSQVASIDGPPLPVFLSVYPIMTQTLKLEVSFTWASDKDITFCGVHQCFGGISSPKVLLQMSKVTTVISVYTHKHLEGI